MGTIGKLAGGWEGSQPLAQGGWIRVGDREVRREIERGLGVKVKGSMKIGHTC